MKKQDKNIEIEEDINHQKRSWRFQKIGMVVLLLLFVVFLTGLAGKGPLSKANADSGKSTFNVEYEKIARLSLELDLKILIRSGSTDSDTIKIHFQREFFDAVDIQRIIPSPVDESFDNENLTFSFLTNGNKKPLQITYSYKFKTSGRIPSRIKIEEDELLINHYVLP